MFNRGDPAGAWRREFVYRLRCDPEGLLTSALDNEPGRILGAVEVSQWPEPERRNPRFHPGTIWSSDCFRRRSGAKQIAHSSAEATCEMLDIGCGNKPYLPFFADRVSSWGVDAVGGLVVDKVSTAVELPFGDAEFDVAVCPRFLSMWMIRSGSFPRYTASLRRMASSYLRLTESSYTTRTLPPATGTTGVGPIPDLPESSRSRGPTPKLRSSLNST